MPDCDWLGDAIDEGNKRRMSRKKEKGTFLIATRIAADNLFKATHALTEGDDSNEEIMEH